MKNIEKMKCESKFLLDENGCLTIIIENKDYSGTFNFDIEETNRIRRLLKHEEI